MPASGGRLPIQDRQTFAAKSVEWGKNSQRGGGVILDDLRNALDKKLLPWAKSQGLQELPAYALEEPPAGIEADIACNLALLLAKPLKKSPRALAEELRKVVDGAL